MTENCREILATLVTNRAPGAYYNAADINRIGKAVKCLAEEMGKMGYPVSIAPPTDWTMSDIYYDTDAALLMSAVTLIKKQVSSTKPQSFPESFEGLDYVGANNIEKFLMDIDDLLAAIQVAYIQCGVEQAGGII